MAVTQETDILDPQILIEQIAGEFRGKNAFMGSIFVTQGAVRVSGTMPEGGAGAIGKTITIPYFGTIGDFVSNPEGSSITPSKIATASEQGTVTRMSLAGEVSRWAQGKAMVKPELGDPYAESARQAMMSATRAMDKLIIDEAATTPLIKDHYNSSSPSYLDWQKVIRAKTLWGDEQDSIVAMVMHSQTLADVSELTDANGRPLLLVDQTLGQESVPRFAGVPIVVSDRVPLTGSTMGSVTGTGTSAPVATLTGTPLGPWDLVIECQTGGAHETATIRFSVDGGNTWSADIVTAAATVALPLVDTAADSLVGVNGATGVSVAFAAGSFNADNKWTATANLKVSTMILQQDAAAFWYNAQRLQMQQDVDILEDTDIFAMHLYSVPKLYRRRRGGSRPGCIRITHNVRNYVG